jgi:hypothetical protein
MSGPRGNSRLTEFGIRLDLLLAKLKEHMTIADYTELTGLSYKYVSQVNDQRCSVSSDWLKKVSDWQLLTRDWVNANPFIPEVPMPTAKAICLSTQSAINPLFAFTISASHEQFEVHILSISLDFLNSWKIIIFRLTNIMYWFIIVPSIYLRLA